MQDCLFCKIIRKEIPASIVYEDHVTLAFLDIKPVNPGHVLVVPKEHFSDFVSTPVDHLGNIAAAAQKIGRAAMQALGAPGFTIGVNNGRAAGQSVNHMHLHVKPRFEGDGHELWHGKPYREGEMAEVAQKLRQMLD